MSTGGELGRGTTFRGTPFDKRDSLNSDSSWAVFNKSKVSLQLIRTFESGTYYVIAKP